MTSYAHLNFNTASQYCMKGSNSHVFNASEKISTCKNGKQPRKTDIYMFLTCRLRHYDVIVPSRGVMHLLVSLCTVFYTPFKIVCNVGLRWYNL